MNTTNFDNKILQNVLDEINRLKSQLHDLEVYKDDFSEEEINSIKKETLDQLLNNTKILENMKTGELTTKTAAEEARMVNFNYNIQQIKSVLIENFKFKDLLDSYLVSESNFLRDKLSQIKADYGLKKISDEEYNSSVSQILEAISKSTELNEEEKQLQLSIKNRVMNKYEVDEGIEKNKIKQTFINK